ncbi:polysaccharide deacetylase family protein [Bacillus sp. FJAT-26390]|uniref:polysaccharide deacetylase family protein n=1 Tax=Bacillus sp. FJAT-26390 TaxID=1743142 RepID=UPI0008080102|nr:polysaccharide deacetylase family protein [Bacillus sp. FJAT-26390]OBZ09511.1 polysaccharide deacetylase [Bacillus sp. FJAT-26390]
MTVLLLGFSVPEKRDRYFYEKRGEIVWEVPSEDKKIALTFDDGPYPATTDIILDLLKKYDAKATFFVLGNKVERFPETIKREIAEGHEVANHTFNHVYFMRSISDETIRDEIVKTEKALETLTGKKPLLFRPPGGYYNEHSIQIAKTLGYTTIMWSWHQDTNDWKSPGVNRIVSKVLNNARNGDIVLMHDFTPGSTQTVRALETILYELDQRGFEFVTVTELMKGMSSIPINK